MCLNLRTHEFNSSNCTIQYELSITEKQLLHKLSYEDFQIDKVYDEIKGRKVNHIRVERATQIIKTPH